MSTATQQNSSTSAGTRTGDFVWYELRTTDAEGAQDFYAHVVGWKPMPSGNPGGVPYTLMTAQNAGISGIMELTPDMLQAGMKPSWAGFIGVPDVDVYAKRIQDAGGMLHCPPMDIPTIGRFASAQDPHGAEFLIFKAINDRSPERLPEGTPGTVGWRELSANDEATAWQFYSDLFGWKVDRTMDMGPNGTYRIFNNGGPAVGAMMTRDPKNSPVPFWLYYFNVENIDAAANRIREKNGQIIMGPHQVPDDLWIILGLDPQGATFAVVGKKA